MEKKIVAAFDFDGTLTRNETLIPFFVFHYGYWYTLSKLIKIMPVLIGFEFGKSTRLEAKEAILTAFLKGVRAKTAHQWGTEFAEKGIPRLLRSKTMEKLRWHQAQGHRCVLISAGIDVYLEQWSKSEGFNDLICSKLAVDDQGLLTGKLVGANCWGPEKTRRLEVLLGPKSGYELYAYGDSRGDEELLALADHPVRV